MNICFIGPEGSGKGTQADLLAEKLGVPHIIAGDILRARQNEDSPTGELIRKIWSEGGYLPDHEMTEIYLDRLGQADCQNGFIADGFPRSLAQAKSLQDFLAQRNQQIDAAVIIEISEAETFKRLSLRKRFDDTEEKIRSRLHNYHKGADAMIAFYADLGVAKKINGEQSIEVVQNDIVKALGI